MNRIVLTGLDGSNPLAFFAALGALVALDEARPGEPRLSWELAGAWRPILHTSLDVDTLVTQLDADRAACVHETALRFTYPSGDAWVPELKPRPEFLAATLRTWAAAARPDVRRTVDWFTGLLAEGATDNNGNGKPTALHFYAGQQRFLKAACELAEGTTAANLRDAMSGPWQRASPLPVMGWDNTETRDYALRASNPATDKKLGEPGADWLALRGLSLLTNSAHRGDQRTPGVRGGWKSGSYAWPVWVRPATRDVVRALVTLRDLRNTPTHERSRRGIGAVYEARILRSDQGGYGSFTPASVVVRAD